MNSNIRTIHILHHSASILNADFNQTFYNGWHARTALQLASHASIPCEAWTHDPLLKNQIRVSREGVIFRAFPTFPSLKFRLEYSKSLVDYLEKEAKKNDVLIHLHGDRSVLVYDIIRRFARKIPLVVQHHGSSGKAVRALPYSCLERFLFPMVDKFFVLTREKRRYLQSCGVKSDRISIITPGVDTSIFKPMSRKQARSKLGLPEEKDLILYVGRVQTKGLPKVTDAVLSLRSSEDIELVAVGVESTNTSFSSHNQVPIRLVPWVSHEMMPLYYNAANLLVWFVDESVHRYGGIGVSVLEALACETPVVSNTLLNLPKGLRAKVGEIPCSEKDLCRCILKVLENERVYDGGRTIAMKFFDWEIVTSKIVQIYNSVLMD